MVSTQKDKETIIKGLEEKLPAVSYFDKKNNDKLINANVTCTEFGTLPPNVIVNKRNTAFATCPMKIHNGVDLHRFNIT